jgi:hypothetical protein
VSQLPGGFIDLETPDSDERTALQRQLEWLKVEDPILQAMRLGHLNDYRAQIGEAITKAKALLESCHQGTPLAFRLQKLIVRFALKGKEGLTVLLPSRLDIAVAQRFLIRTLGPDWTTVAPHLEWLPFSDALAALNSRSEKHRLVVVGLNRSVMRFVLTHEEIPLGTTLLVPVQQALRSEKTLLGMRSLAALKPYHARIGALLATLKDGLKAVPNIENIARVLEAAPVGARLTVRTVADDLVDPSAHRIGLEDGRVIYASGYLYRYDTEEGTGFSKVQVRTLVPGDLIFEMSDELRDEVEEAVGLRSQSGTIPENSQQKILAMYHREVSEQARENFPSASRSALVRAIRTKILSISAAADISESQIQYWVNLKTGDTAPHGARNHTHFALFCQALGLESTSVEIYWAYIRAARANNQSYGRVLANRFSQILFQPEDEQVYRKIPPAVIAQLRTKAADCVYQIIDIQDPLTVSDKEIAKS